MPPLSTWVALGGDAGEWTAANPTTPPETLEFLAERGGVGMRRRVAGNPATPSGTLRILADDEDPHVRQVAAQALNTASGCP